MHAELGEARLDEEAQARGNHSLVRAHNQHIAFLDRQLNRKRKQLDDAALNRSMQFLSGVRRSS